MRNNKATWVFLGLLAIALVWRGYSLRSEHASAVYPLLVFVFALYTVIAFLEWVAKPPPHGIVRRNLPFLSVFSVGNAVPFWYRQIIFFGGSGLAYLYLLWATKF